MRESAEESAVILGEYILETGATVQAAALQQETAATVVLCSENHLLSRWFRKGFYR